MKWLECLRRRLGLAAPLSSESGQGASEYAIISAAILLGLAFGGAPMWIALARGLQVYFDSFFLVLRLPFP